MEQERHDEDALMTALEFWGRGENWEAGMADASPAVKEGLRRHLAAALALRQDLPEPSPAVESRSRAAWLAAGAQLRAGRQPRAAAAAPASWWAGGFQNRRLAWLAAGLAVWLTLGGGAVWAAERSLPGDNLYPIKTWRQEVLVATARGPEARAKAMQAQEDSYRRDCLAVLAEGREVDVEFFGRLERVEGSVWRIGGLPVDVSSADLSAVLISAMPLEGRRLQVDARTENGRVIGLRVLPAEPLPAVGPGGPGDAVSSSRPVTATPFATTTATALVPGAAGGGADKPSTTDRPSSADFGDVSDDKSDDDKSSGDKGSDDKGGDDKGGDDKGGDDKGGDDKGGDDKGGDDKGGDDKGSDDKGGDDKGGDDKGGDDKGGDDKGGDDKGGDDKGGDDKGGDDKG
ncbi:MAG: hypothetical protein ACH37Z_04160, partial [Anaerolineae bacterium]